MPSVLFKALGVNTYSIYLICLLKHKWKKYYLAWDLFSFNSLPWVHLECHPDNRPWCDSPKLCRKRAQKQPAWASWQLLCQLTGPPGSTSPVSLSECGMPLSPSAHSRGWWSFPLPLQPHPSGTRYKKKGENVFYTQYHFVPMTGDCEYYTNNVGRSLTQYCWNTMWAFTHLNQRVLSFK